MSKAFFLMIRTILVAALFTPLFALVEVETTVDRSEITIGDKIQYQITVQFPSTGSLEMPSALGNLGQFEVKDYSQAPAEKSGDGRTQIWKFTLSTFTVGEYVIPPQIIEYTPENDTTKQILNTEPIKIKVNRTTAETVKDIADITGLATLKGKSHTGLILLILFLIIIIGGLAYWLYKSGKPKQIEKPRLPPFEEAMESLSRLFSQGLVNQGKSKEYCFKLSEILRTYISRRFSIDALESTTEEFLEKIKHIDVTQANRESLTAFCEKTDLVKFADTSLSEEEGKSLHQQIKEFIHFTKPRVEPTSEKASTKTKGDT